MSPPGEGLQVALHLGGIERQGALNRGPLQRYPPHLPGKAQQQGVGVKGIAQQVFGQDHGVEPAQVLRPHCVVQHLVALP